MKSQPEQATCLRRLTEVLENLPLEKIKQVEKYITSLGKKALSLREALK